MVGKIILLVLALNILTCLAERAGISKDREMAITQLRPEGNGKRIYLIGGILSRTEHTFDFILGAIPAGYGVYLVDYRNWGFDLVASARALRQHILTHGASDATVDNYRLRDMVIGQPIVCYANAGHFGVGGDNSSAYRDSVVKYLS